MRNHLCTFSKAGVAPLALGQKMEGLLVTYRMTSVGRAGNHEGGGTSTGWEECFHLFLFREDRNSPDNISGKFLSLYLDTDGQTS